MHIPVYNSDARQKKKRRWNFSRVTNLATVIFFILVIFVIFSLSTYQLAIKLADIAYRSTDIQNKTTAVIGQVNIFLGNPIRLFPYSQKLIGWSNQVLINHLQLTLVNEVVIGKDGWLFTNDSRSVEDYRGAVRYTDQELSVFTATLESRKNWLLKRGIPLLLVIAPNKESIYPEFLPDGIKKVNESTRLDQLIDYLKLNSNVDLLDLRSPLLHEKQSYQLYYKTDSHWNSYGAYFAYSEMIKRMKNYFPAIEAFPLADYMEKVDNPSGAGDLAGLIMMEDTYTERQFHLEKTEDAGNIATAKIPRAVIYHDSFYNALQPFLARHFDRISDFQYDAINGSFDEHILEKEKPDVVIYVMVERWVPRYFLKGYDFFKIN